MESVEFLMLTGAKIASVALPRSLPAHQINRETTNEASYKVALGQFVHATFISLYINLSLFLSGGRKQILLLLPSFWVSPKT